MLIKKRQVVIIAASEITPRKMMSIFSLDRTPKRELLPMCGGGLNSITLTPDVSMTIPDALTAGCQPVGFASVEELSSGLEAYIHQANTGGLIYEYINDSIDFAIWGSEGQEYGRDEFFGRLASSYYSFHANNVAEGEPSQMTFTTDRGQFPPLMGTPAETMFGPHVTIAEVIYSEGWGQDGLGAALLFIAEDDCGGFYWHGLVYSNEYFDK
jgi:hypothetical protein